MFARNTCSQIRRSPSSSNPLAVSSRTACVPRPRPRALGPPDADAQLRLVARDDELARADELAVLADGEDDGVVAAADAGEPGVVLGARDRPVGRAELHELAIVDPRVERVGVLVAQRFEGERHTLHDPMSTVTATWLADVLGVPSLEEGATLTVRGQELVVRDGIPRVRQLLSDDQAETTEMFGFKWTQEDTFTRPEALELMRGWLESRYGRVADAPWWGEYGGRPLVLDAGCGAGVSGLEVFGPLGDRVRYLGADLTPAVDVARRRFADRGLDAAFLQADLTRLPLAPGSVDVIFSEGVLHHTDSTEGALKAVAPLLRPGGRILFYVYRRKSLIREFTDDAIRAQLQEMTPEEAWDGARAADEARHRARRAGRRDRRARGHRRARHPGRPGRPPAAVLLRRLQGLLRPGDDVRRDAPHQLRLVRAEERLPPDRGGGPALVRRGRPRRGARAHPPVGHHDHRAQAGVTFEEYGRLIALGPPSVRFADELPERALLLRHDIDDRPKWIEPMARVEAEQGAVSTYCLQVRSRFYGLDDEADRAVRTLLECGHELGLHFDSSAMTSDDEVLEGVIREVTLLESRYETRGAGRLVPHARRAAGRPPRAARPARQHVRAALLRRHRLSQRLQPELARQGPGDRAARGDADPVPDAPDAVVGTAAARDPRGAGAAAGNHRRRARHGRPEGRAGGRADSVACHQPNFLPWLGYFDKLAQCDRFVLLDDVQFPRTSRGTYTNRVQLMIGGKPAWLTAPVVREGVQRIREVRVDDRQPWRRKALRTIEMEYARAPGSPRRCRWCGSCSSTTPS